MPATTALPAWSHLEPGEPLYGAPFDATFDEALSGVAYGDGFVLVGRTRDDEGRWRGGIWSSPDGVAWSRVTADDEQFDGVFLWHIATDGKRLVVLGWGAPVGVDQWRGPYRAWLSDDGVSWAQHDVEETALGQIDVNGIVGSATGFLAWGGGEEGRTGLLRSVDGLAWESIDYPGAGEDNVSHVAPLGAGYLAVGAKFNIDRVTGGPSEPARAWWSPDGRQWEATEVPGGFALRGVYPGAAGVYAVGARECSRCVGPSLAWGSPDGRRWRSLGEEKQLYPFVGSNGSTIAAFEWQGDRSISLSSDGLAWQKVVANLPAADHDAGLIVGSTGVLLLMAKTPLDRDDVQVIHQGVLFMRGT